MRKLLFAAALVLAPLTACSKSEKAEKAAVEHELREMTVEEVAAGLEAKTLTAVDCNGDKTRKRVGVLPGAILIADEDTFTAADLPSDKTTKLVFYCGGPG